MTLRVRAARPDAHDYAAFVQFWHELGLDDHPPHPRDQWDEHLCPSTLFLEAEDGRLAAYGLSFPFGDRGDVRQIVVGSAFRRQGVGRQIMAAVAARLRAAGCTNWRLEVRAENAAAIALYRSVGMEVVHAIHIVYLSRADAERFAATRSGRHEVTVVDPADDAMLEARFDLGRGQIARWRTFRGHCPILHVGDRALTQVWRDFEPGKGLLFPFRAVDGDVAAHLMAVAPPMPEQVGVYVVDEPVLDALVAAGATRHEEQLEMGGPLPNA